MGSGVGIKVLGLGLGGHCFGCRAKGVGCGVSGVGGVHCVGFGCRVQGLQLRVYRVGNRAPSVQTEGIEKDDFPPL